MYKVWGCLLMLIWGCDSQGELGRVEFPTNCWHLSDSLSSYPINWDEKDYLDASLYVDFSDDFAYRNIILRMDWELPSGTSGDTLLRAYVVDSLGYWIPPMLRNKSYRYTFAPLSILLDEPPAALRVTQFMRDSSLCGINGVGITLTMDKKLE